MKAGAKTISVDYAVSIKEIRLALGETQKTMAKRLRVSERGYQYWEEGKRTPGGAALAKIRELVLKEAMQASAEAAFFSEPHIFPPAATTSPAARHQLHTALDLILDRAPETIKMKVAEVITGAAGKYSDKK